MIEIYYRCNGTLLGYEPWYEEFEVVRHTMTGTRIWTYKSVTDAGSIDLERSRTKFIQESRWEKADGRCFARPTKAQAFQDYLARLRHRIAEAEREQACAKNELEKLERLNPDGTAPLLLLTAHKTRQLFLPHVSFQSGGLVF